MGVFAWLHLEKYQVRRTVKHQLMEHIQRDALVKLTFHQDEVANQLDWEHEREFTFNGEMYDVVEHEVHGDSISYWCWEDKAESALNQQLAGLTDQWLGHAPERKEHQEQVLRFIRQLFHVCAPSFIALQHTDRTTEPKPYLASYCPIALAQTSPPPEV